MRRWWWQIRLEIIWGSDYLATIIISITVVFFTWCYHSFHPRQGDSVIGNYSGRQNPQSGEGHPGWGETKRIFWLFRGKNNLCCWLIDGKTVKVIHKDVSLCPRRSWENRELSFFKEIFRWVQRAWLHQPQTSLLCSKIELFKRKRLNFQMKTRDERFNDSLIASFPQSDITQFTVPIRGAVLIH